MSLSDPRKAIEAVYRIEAPRLLAGLVRLVRDVDLAEELAQDALVTALEKWPVAGVPDNPGAWLMTAAKNRALNSLSRRKLLERKHQEIGRELETEERQDPAPVIDAALDDAVGDDLLRLVFIACHPVLSPDARVALTLRMLGGLSTEEIARAFLASEPAIAQRIVRAKKSLAEARVPFEWVSQDEVKARLESVLEVIYLIFNEGYAATAGDDWMRPALCDEAQRLGRILVGLLPNESEVHGVVALIELHASRSPARTGQDGEPKLLLEQNRARWDRLLLCRGLAALERAESLATGAASAEQGSGRGFYTLQAAISACHGRAATADETDWARIASLYAELFALTGSPVVELNRAVAVGMAHGAAAGLEVLDRLASEGALKAYYLLPAARGDMLEKLGRNEEARAQFEEAAGMTKNEQERKVLLGRAAKLR